MEEAAVVGAAADAAADTEDVVAGADEAAWIVKEEIAEEMSCTLLSILVCIISNRLQDD